MRRLILATLAATMLAICSGCGGGVTSSPAGSGTSPASEITPGQLTSDYSAMAALRPVVDQGGAPIAVLLPETATASYFADIAKPDMEKAFAKAGLATSQYMLDLSPGPGQIQQAKAAIAKGARVLILDSRYSGEGVSIEAYAQAHHVQVIDYDWLNIGGSAGYYVGFDSLKIGVLLGQGLVSCASAWGVKHPHVIVMQGGTTDYNAAVYAQGYGAVLARRFGSGWTDVSNPPGTWDPLVALTEFQQQYAAHRTINAALIPNDENAAPIISYLQSARIRPRTFPITGLDATLIGLRNILAGYQCGTVYKPIDVEVQATAALAIYLRAAVTSPTLASGTIYDPQSGRSVPAVLLTPEWVTARNMKATVIQDQFATAAQVCTTGYAQDCAAAGLG